jgi:NADH-quinone oxidoreductase chain G
MITLTINEKEITIDRPMSVLDAARQAGIKIPTLCHHEMLRPYGGCRLCVVEVERMRGLQNACSLMAADGMVVRTESEEITKARRGILEFLLINHPLDCPYCDKAGECELQDLVNIYGPTVGRYMEQKRKVPESHKDRLLTRNMERCVACTRCVRMCHDLQGASAIDMVGRGNRTRMEPFSSESFNCEYCGNCLTVCPVGAILSRLYLHSFRPWQIDREVETVCSYCGVGCSMNVQVRDEVIKRVVPKPGRGVNKGLLCCRGRFGYEYVASPERLKVPLIRKDGRLVESSWSEAVEYVAGKLNEIKKASGGEAIAGIASARCSNEDNYVFQKFIRLACGSNNIDSVSGTEYAAAQKYFEALLGQGITANLLGGIKNSDMVLVLGGDPTAVSPVLGLAVREAFRRGADVAVIGPAGGLSRFMTTGINPPLFQEALLLEALLASVAASKGLRGEKLDIDKGIRILRDKHASEPDIEGFARIRDLLCERRSISVVFGMDLVRRSDGFRSMFAVAGLVYLTEGRLYLLSGRPNDQGIVDMGCMPDMLPGSRPLDLFDFRRKYEMAWGAKIPDKNGLGLLDMIKAVSDGKVRAMYVMGENPVVNIPDSDAVAQALKSLDLLVVQDIFMTETAELAHVVLPALGWAEKTGTFTNLERRIQLHERAVNALSGMEDWRIICEISTKMGYRMSYAGSEDVFREIASVSPLYRDLTYAEIEKGGTLWPYMGEPLRGEMTEPPEIEGELPEYADGLYLVTDVPLFHSGTLSRHADALMKLAPEPRLKIGPDAAQRLGLKEGDVVSFTTAAGTGQCAVMIDERIEDNRVLLSNNFQGMGVNRFLKYRPDPVTGAPGLEGNVIRLEKV